MSEIDELTVGRFQGIAVIEDQLFEEASFASFTINPEDGAEVTFRNCIFRKCEVTKGAFQLGKNVVLDNVVFDNVKINGHFDIHSAVKISATKFINCRKQDVLWIQNILKEVSYEANKIDLDISQFEGEVIITGVDVTGVKIAFGKHIFINKSLLEQTELKINRANFFRSSASKVKANGGELGVFSLPESKRATPEFIEQLEFFKRKGFVRD